VVKTIKHRVSTNSIFRQLVVNSLIISIIPIALGAVIIFRLFFNMSREIAMSSYEQVVTQYMYDIDEKFTLADARLKHLSVDNNIIEDLSGGGEKDNPITLGEDISTELIKILQLDTTLDYYNCIIYSVVEDVPAVGRGVTSIKEAEIESWYQEERLKDGTKFFYRTANGKTCLLSMVRQIISVDPKTQESMLVGYIKLDINARNFFYANNGISDEDAIYDVIVLDSADNLVYETWEGADELLASVSELDIGKGELAAFKDRLIFMDRVDSGDYKVFLVFDNKAYVNQRIKVIIPIIIIFMTLILAVILLSYVFAKKFSSRINLLVNKMKQIENGDFSVSEAIGGNDEIAELDKDFMQMQKELNNLINKNYIQTLINKEFELKNLQLQINPHFLYNTLESISSMSAVKGNYDICEICEKLGEVFRYSLGKNYGNYVPLSQEIKHIQNYVFIQKTRFGDKFDVYYSIPKELMNCQILRFILQPIVENAIIHGVIPNAKPGNIEISAQQNGNELVITVEDDGVGMNKEKLDEMNEYIKKDINATSDKPGSIGIRNVNKRIELTCGERYGIEIKSMPEKGSRFEIRLPYIEQGA
jgi:sensor histidine kinase YesM